MGSVTHSTPSDGTFSASGATAWDAAHTLSLTSSDVGLGSVTNDAQTKAAVVPNTAPSAGQILVGNAGGTAYAPLSVTGDIAVSSAGAATIPSYTFTTLPAASSNSGRLVRVTDIGPATAGSYWVSNGTIWKPVGGRVTLATLSGRVSVAGGGSETIGHQFQLPTAFLSVLDRIRIYSSVSKAGTATTGTLSVRVGTLGTTSDALITGTGGAVLSAANRAGGFINDLVVQSATSIGKVGTAISVGASYGAASATAYAAATTISNVSNSLWITVTITPGATDATALEDNQIVYECV